MDKTARHCLIPHDRKGVTSNSRNENIRAIAEKLFATGRKYLPTGYQSLSLGKVS